MSSVNIYLEKIQSLKISVINKNLPSCCIENNLRKERCNKHLINLK